MCLLQGGACVVATWGGINMVAKMGGVHGCCQGGI